MNKRMGGFYEREYEYPELWLKRAYSAWQNKIIFRSPLLAFDIQIDECLLF